jgi:uncharacterized protein with HEPN domain
MDSNFAANHPELPLIEMRGMRNKVIHNYFDVDWEVVWSTVKDDLPRLKKQIDALLKRQQRTKERHDEGKQGSGLSPEHDGRRCAGS